jgi:nucleotide-binding universal stress UspA family protein
MTYATLMVHLDVDHPNDTRLRIAGELAEQFNAGVIGVAACELVQSPYFAEGAVAAELIEKDRALLRKRIDVLQDAFRAALKGRAREIAWRSDIALPTDYVVRAARAADLIITGANRDGALLDPVRRLDPSELVIRAGRPVFVVPQQAEHLALNRVMVAWKDTREARRAVVDALPLLAKAKDVVVVEVVEEDDQRAAARARIDEVVAWLAHHGISATARVPTPSRDVVPKLEAVADELGIDLVVAGAYGHTRLREWVLGGVTRHLVTRSRRCSLLSH